MRFDGFLAMRDYLLEVLWNFIVWVYGTSVLRYIRVLLCRVFSIILLLPIAVGVGLIAVSSFLIEWLDQEDFTTSAADLIERIFCHDDPSH